MTPRSIAAAAALALIGSPVFAAALTAGDVYVYRIGTGSAALSSAATAVFIDEFTTTGSFVQSIAMPTLASGLNGALTASGSATSEGALSVSANGAYLVLAGYDAAPGTASVASTASATTPRTVGLLNRLGTVDTSTRLTDAAITGNNIRSATSVDGSGVYVGAAAGGVRYAATGSSTSTQLSTTVTNVRNVEVAGGQLYVSSSSGSTVRLGAVGTGTPTTAGQVIGNLPGLPSSTGSPYAYYFADLSASVAGLDTLYVADDGQGILKYSLVGGSWVANGTVGTAANSFRGLTGTVLADGSVSLFATGGSSLVTVQDSAGYNGAFAGSLTTLATAAANTAFRGVAYLEPLAAVPEPQSWALMAAGLGLLAAAARRRPA
jgi:hypothetical protein